MTKNYLYGVDVGGTTCKLGRFSREGEVLEKWEIPTDKKDNGKNIVANIGKAIIGNMTKNGISRENVLGVGLGVPGPVLEDGSVSVCVNLGWGACNPTKELEDILGLPVKTGNDANIAALGEQWKGAGRGYNNLVLLTLGTGIGGGVIIDGNVLNGSTGAGGEIGHIHLEDDETEQCNCEGYGCFEQYGSATGIVRIGERILKATEEPSVLREKELSAKAIWDAVKEGDKVAKDIAEKYGFYLGKGMAMIAGVTNPEAFVIGGGVSRAGEIIFDYAVKYYNKYVFKGAKDVKFTLATLGNDAGIYGAARMVLK